MGSDAAIVDVGGAGASLHGGRDGGRRGWLSILVDKC